MQVYVAVIFAYGVSGELSNFSFWRFNKLSRTSCHLYLLWLTEGKKTVCFKRTKKLWGFPERIYQIMSQHMKVGRWLGLTDIKDFILFYFILFYFILFIWAAESAGCLQYYMNMSVHAMC